MNVTINIFVLLGVAIILYVIPAQVFLRVIKRREQDRELDQLASEAVTKAQEAVEVAAQGVEAVTQAQKDQATDAAENSQRHTDEATIIWGKLTESAITQVDTAQDTQSKLDIIHTLVNSNLSASIQAELDATVRELALMKEVMAMRLANGDEPSPETLATVIATEEKIEELKEILDKRRQTDGLVEILIHDHPAGDVQDPVAKAMRRRAGDIKDPASKAMRRRAGDAKDPVVKPAVKKRAAKRNKPTTNKPTSQE